MGMALDAGNNFYQELWRNNRSLPTTTPYAALTVMNPVGSTKRREMSLLAECCITELCSTAFHSYTKTPASLVLFSTLCLQLICPSCEPNNRTASLQSSVWNGLRCLALNVLIQIG